MRGDSRRTAVAPGGDVMAQHDGSSQVLVGCGPDGFAWAIDNAALRRLLAARWQAHAARGPAAVVLSVRQAPLIDQAGRGTLEPLAVLEDPVTSDVTFRFGTLLRVRWERAAARMTCTLDQSFALTEAAAILESAFASLAAVWLRMRGGALLHAAGVLDGETADLFVGYSGVGKSTLASLAPAANVLHDDTLILTASQGICQVAQPPWRRYGPPALAGRLWTVGRVFVLQRHTAPGMERLPVVSALAALLRVGVLPSPGWESVAGGPAAALTALVQRHACYRLCYRLGQDDPWAWIMDRSGSAAGG